MTDTQPTHLDLAAIQARHPASNPNLSTNPGSVIQDHNDIRDLLDENARLRARIAELTMTPRERANAHCRALREAGDLEGAIAYAEAFEASEAYEAAHPRY